MRNLIEGHIHEACHPMTMPDSSPIDDLTECRKLIPNLGKRQPVVKSSTVALTTGGRAVIRSDVLHSHAHGECTYPVSP